jgi:hypothetical protein
MPRLNQLLRLNFGLFTADIVKSHDAVVRLDKIGVSMESRIKESDSDASTSKPGISVEPICGRNDRKPIYAVRVIVSFDVCRFLVHIPKLRHQANSALQELVGRMKKTLRREEKFLVVGLAEAQFQALAGFGRKRRK